MLEFQFLPLDRRDQEFSSGKEGNPERYVVVDDLRRQGREREGDREQDGFQGSKEQIVKSDSCKASGLEAAQSRRTTFSGVEGNRWRNTLHVLAPDVLICARNVRQSHWPAPHALRNCVTDTGNPGGCDILGLCTGKCNQSATRIT